jgi:esterase/lipase superfamily enzyme
VFQVVQGMTQALQTGRFRVIAVFLCLGFLLSACGARPDAGALAISFDPAPETTVHDILVATTRDRDTRPGTYFNGERREDGLDYAEVSISVPPTHQPGKIEWADTAPGNPAKHFVARKANYLEGESRFRARLDERLSRLPPGKRSVFLFIHGYNTRFAEGVFRYAQLLNDAEFPGVPLLFTWASQGKTTGYLYDLNSAAIARDGLENTMKHLANSKADRIIILAHSMGNWLLLETGSRASPQIRGKLARKIDHVVLAAPDIDIDLFKAHMRRIGKPERPYIVIVSRDDRALRLSRAIGGGKQRLGAYDNDEELAELGAIVVNLTDFESPDASNHSKFAQLATLGPDFREAVAKSGLTAAASETSARQASYGQGLAGFLGNTARVVVTLPSAIAGSPRTAADGIR